MKAGSLSNIGDIQIDNDKTEWVVVGIGHMGVSRVRRNSLAHQTHAQSSPKIAESLARLDKEPLDIVIDNGDFLVISKATFERKNQESRDLSTIMEN